MKLKTITVTAILLVMPQVLMAAPSINDMQGCQGLLDFIDGKLDSAPSNYEAEDVQKVRLGLDGYNQYIQRTIITPGLLEFNQGDEAKAKAMQEQVDAYKQSLVDSYELRYPQNRLFTDHAMAVNNCATQMVPSGQELEDLKEALNTMVKLAQLN